jgi:cytochrome c peroxidase
MKNIKALFFITLMSFFSFCKMDEIGVNTYNLTDIPCAPRNFTVEVPIGFPPVEAPADNPMTREGVELGRHLFYDVRLSKGEKMSCGSCHLPQNGFSDPNRFSTGVNGQITDRQSMAIQNLGIKQVSFFWDGRAASLEAQALQPVENHIELDENWDNVLKKLRADTMYHRLFRQAFCIRSVNEITKELAAKGIAQFERTIVVGGESRYHKVFVRQQGFPTDEELDGSELFQEVRGDKGKCTHCHNMSQNLFKSGTGALEFTNNGLDYVTDLNSFADNGHGRVTGNRNDNGKFHAPTLWNIALSAPYMHDGRFNTLKKMIDFYADAPKSGPNLDPSLPKIHLDDVERESVLRFLETLTDTISLKKPQFQNPFRKK